MTERLLTTTCKSAGVIASKRLGTIEGQPYECGAKPDSCPVQHLRVTLADAMMLLRRYEEMELEFRRLKSLLERREQAVSMMALLTPRQHEIMALVLVGRPSKNIATDLHISQRTVENHRAAIMKKTNARSLPELGQIGLAAALHQPAQSLNVD